MNAAVFRSLKWLALLVAACASAGMGRRASAEPVVFAFQGNVERVFDGLGALDDATVTARTLAGYYVFDSRTPNTGGKYAEGFEGIYHHERPPAGVVVRVGHGIFRSDLLRPDFDIVVHDEFGFVGSDDYGFTSRRNVAFGVHAGPHVDRLDIDWFASTFQNDPIHGVDLPLVPPDLHQLGGGTFTIYGECTVCAAPAAFYRIEGTLTSLRRVFHHADLTGDGVVGRADVAELIRNFGMHPDALMIDGDMNEDGAITLADLRDLQAAFGVPVAAAGSTAAVPEPASVVLAMLGIAIAFGYARRRRA